MAVYPALFIHMHICIGSCDTMVYEKKERENKAGYTATSCGRVGRGGNARFPTFQLERDGPTDRPTDQPTDQPTDGRTKPLIELRVRN